MPSTPSRTFVVVSQTHWEREWYQPFRVILRGNRDRPERGEVIWAMTNPIWLRAG